MVIGSKPEFEIVVDFIGDGRWILIGCGWESNLDIDVSAHSKLLGLSLDVECVSNSLSQGWQST